MYITENENLITMQTHNYTQYKYKFQQTN